MLELRPNCEHCQKPLPPHSTEARICSFECTFCSDCAENLLGNVCPNCGGGFVPRPIRPTRDWKNQNCLLHYPASQRNVFRPVSLDGHARFAASIKDLPPESR